MNPVAPRDAMRLADSVYSGNLWRRQLKGEKIFISAYEPLERIDHYNRRTKRYAEYLAKHIAGGSTWDDIMTIIESALAFIPKEIKDEVIKYIITTVKEWIFGKDKTND